MVDTEKAFASFETAKTLLEFGETEVKLLVGMAPLARRHGPALRDHFYASLARYPETAKMIAGRVDSLKATHEAWMMELFGGEYGRPYFDARWRIGLAHVRIGLDPVWVEGVMSLVRTLMAEAIGKESATPAEAVQRVAALTKICDLDLIVINLSYGEDRLDRLGEFTGMKRSLVENLIRIPRR